ncbi:MAG: A/G-specific adenine glycosylase [Ferrovum sp.]|nr:A/G-specific adenine glycosylase [Ferrovum sp.]NDU87539.1 A/G-specific adenine glycosylase [Ferrovum sp.]
MEQYSNRFDPACPATHSFALLLNVWQRQYGRHTLPWQGTQDPYLIWVSEIMLQQTQVRTVIPYYQRFLSTFPTVETLAQSSLDQVLSHWSGLGYYARARHLHRAAQLISANGGFPRTVADLCTLPGIGRSTAGAIAAFAYGDRAAILDGNVKRILCRVFALTSPAEEELWQVADALLPDSENIATYTQGLMDLGTLRCLRNRPLCSDCPLAGICQAHQTETIAQYPSRPKRPQRQVRHSRLLLIDNAQGQWLMQRKPPTGIWAGLWSFPEETLSPDLPSSHSLGLDGEPHTMLSPIRHLLTHVEWHLYPIMFHSADSLEFPADPSYGWFTTESMEQLALPAPIRRLLPQLTMNDARTLQGEKMTSQGFSEIHRTMLTPCTTDGDRQR